MRLPLQSTAWTSRDAPSSFCFSQGPWFKWPTAAILARLSHIVYKIKNGDEAEERRAKSRCNSCITGDVLDFDVVVPNIENGRAINVAIVVISRSSIYLVFRGTDNMENVGQDLRLSRFTFSMDGEQDDEKKGKVHRGFYEAQDKLWGRLKAPESVLGGYLQNPNFRDSLQNFYIGGHSLGGAMAVITAARLVNELDVKRIDGVYTFGCPDLFDSYAAKRYREHPVLKGRTFRVEYENDAVPRIFQKFRLYFDHPGDTSIQLRAPRKSLFARRHPIKSYVEAINLVVHGDSVVEKLRSQAKKEKKREIARLEKELAIMKADLRLLRRELSG